VEAECIHRIPSGTTDYYEGTAPAAAVPSH